MKILWFTNNPTLEMMLNSGKGKDIYRGHFLAQLLPYLSKVKDIELGVVAACPGMRDAQFKKEGISYFVISQPRHFHSFNMRQIDIKKCVGIVEAFVPDLIHIHGSERFYGSIKAKKLTRVPALLSLQGLLGSFSLPRNYFGALSLIEIVKCTRILELPIRIGILWGYYYAKKAAIRERKILASVDGIIGRTEWDRNHAKICNHNTPYFTVGELLRPAFYENRWILKNCNRHTLIYTNSGNPSRGTENLLAAISLLANEFPDIRLKLAGHLSVRSGYGRFIRRKIKAMELNNRVELLGYIDDKIMVQELLLSHVFVITSYIENSPNSLAEAMLVGMPCVASYVGGIPDMVHDGNTGLLFPVDDVPLLASKIRNIFLDDSMAISLGKAAHDVAYKKHNAEVVISQLMVAYNGVLKSSSTILQ